MTGRPNPMKIENGLISLQLHEHDAAILARAVDTAIAHELRDDEALTLWRAWSIALKCAAMAAGAQLNRPGGV